MSEERKNYITLQQFLKKEGIASTGGQAKIMIQNAEILVNGETEVRRGRKLYSGDRVEAYGKTYLVTE